MLNWLVRLGRKFSVDDATSRVDASPPGFPTVPSFKSPRSSSLELLEQVKSESSASDSVLARLGVDRAITSCGQIADAWARLFLPLPIFTINALYKADCRERRPFRRHFPSVRQCAQGTRNLMSSI